MEFLEQALEKIYNTIKYNGLYIFLSILFPIMFYQLDAGREIVMFILNPDQQFNISLIAFSFFLISVSIWCVPVVAIDMFKAITNSKEETYKIFYKIDRNYSGFAESTIDSGNADKVEPQVPVYILSILPWVIFISNLALVFFNKKIYFLGGIFICVVGIIILKKVLKDHKPRIKNYFLHQRKRKWIFFYISGLIFLIYFIIPLPLPLEAKSGPFIIAYYFIGLILLYSFIFIYDFIRKLELENKEGFVGTVLGFNYRSSRLIHLTILISVSVLWIMFYFFNRNASLGMFNPIVISLVISCVLILFLEFFILSQLLIIKIVAENSLKQKLYRFAVLVLTGFTLYVYFLSSPNNHLIRKENIVNYVKSDYDRLSLEDYFQKWYDEKNKDNTNQIKDKVFTVYLVSGQGGGSRAAVWFLMNMLYMDAKDPNFYNHIFSISTVSGSSSGANMYYALHQLGTPLKYDKSLKNGKVKSSGTTSFNPIKNFTTSLYNRNFLSSGLFGLLLNDFSIDAFTNRINDERRDRNFTLQNEELKAFQESYFKLFPTNYLDLKDPALQEEAIRDSLTKMQTIKNYFEGDYLNIYRNNFTNPLFFLNSTVIDDGTKGVFSPVKMDFSMFRDLYGDYRMCNASDGYALPMVSCVNQSQAFPLMNSYNYLHGSGRLGDGGLYENSGTETTLEIYKTLRKFCDEKQIKVEFVFINLMNSQIKGKQNINFTKASYLNTVSAMAKNPFFGHEYMAYYNLKKEIAQPTDFISIIPESSYTLTRMLSASTINLMFENVIGKENRIPDNALNKISPDYKKATSLQNVPFKIETDSLSPVKVKPKIFIQYAGKFANAKKIESAFIKFSEYEIKTIDYVPIDDLKNSIRYFHAEDEDEAKNIQQKLKKFSGRDVKIKNYGKEFPFVPKQQFEIWLAK